MGRLSMCRGPSGAWLDLWLWSGCICFDRRVQWGVGMLISGLRGVRCMLVMRARRRACLRLRHRVLRRRRRRELGGMEGVVVLVRRGWSRGILGPRCIVPGSACIRLMPCVNVSMVGNRGWKGGRFTWSIASLCISWPLQAGIISFRTPNSSFIFDLRRRSIRLCAVFLAILRPAALVLLVCFLLVPVGVLVAAVVLAFCACGCELDVSWLSLGFIWMILRDRVGGGGSE